MSVLEFVLQSVLEFVVSLIFIIGVGWPITGVIVKKFSK